MKKKITMALLVVCTVLSGCGNTEQVNIEQSTSVVQVSEEPQKIEETKETVQEEVIEKTMDETASEVSESAEVPNETNIETEEITFELLASYEIEKLPQISENGNPYNFPVEKLGYYTNGYWGFDFKQINGDVLVCDKYEYGYLVSENDTFNIMDNNTFNISQVEDINGDVEFADDGTFQLSRYQADFVERTQYLYAPDAYKNDPVYGDICILDKYGSIGVFQKAKLGEFKLTDDVMWIRMHWNFDAQFYDYGMEYYNKNSITNSQPVANRRDHDKYPKYIKNIPTDKFYIYGNPNTDSSFWILKVRTVPQEGASERDAEKFFNPYMYEIELSKCIFYDEDKRWKIDNLDVDTIRIYAFGESQTEHIGLIFGIMDEPFSYWGYSDDGDEYYLKLDCTDIASGQIVLKSNLINKMFYLESESDITAMKNGATFTCIDEDSLKALDILYYVPSNGWKPWSLE